MPIMIIADRMTISVSEKKKRQIYRSDVQGLMPFEIRGLDDKIPSAELSAHNISEGQFTIARTDIDSGWLSDLVRCKAVTTL
jgi:hypothetical protein